MEVVEGGKWQPGFRGQGGHLWMKHWRKDGAYKCTSFPVVARVWNMMSGQAREGRLELRARSRVASSCGRPLCREARDSFLVRCTGQKTHKLGCPSKVCCGENMTYV